MRTSLHTREDRSIHERREIVYCFFWCFQWITYSSLRQDHCPSRSSERFVRRRRHHLKSCIERIFQCTRSDKPCDMCHIRHRHRTDLCSDCRKLRIVQLSRIRTKPCKDNLRLGLHCGTSECIIVDSSRRHICHPIADEVKYLRKIGHWSTMGEMSTMGEIHTEYRVSRFEPRCIGTNIGYSTTEWLDISVISMEKLFRTIDSKLFDLIGKLLSPIISPSWCSLTIFISKDSRLRSKDRS